MADFDATRLRLDRNQLIEASAGTGKTYTITNLCLRLLLGRDAERLEIQQILILTFTIAATDELKYRIAQRIREARDAFSDGTEDAFLQWLVDGSADPGRDIRLLTAAGQLMDEASIFTIHGFCARVLGEQAFESGTLFNQELNADRNQILQSAAEDCFRREVIGLPSEIRTIAQRLWRNPESLAASVQPFLFRGELSYHPADLSQFDPELTVEKARRAMAGWCEHHIDELIRDANLFKGRKPQKMIDAMTAFCQQGEVDLNSELWTVYSAATIARDVTGKSKHPRHTILDLVDEVAGELGTLRAWLWNRMLDRMTWLINQHKAVTHSQTIDDLLTMTADAVRRPGAGLAETMGKRWPLAMVDEFQDTDSIQYTIFSTVYPPDAVDRHLLMIGDPKQAIYSFRGADVFTYINARRDAREIHSLSVNWRSSPAMIDAVNTLFKPPETFGNSADMHFEQVTAAPPHVDMAVKHADKPCRPFQVFVVDEPGETVAADDAVYATMEHAAEETARLLASGEFALTRKSKSTAVAPGEIAFLVRRWKDAVAAQQALSRRGIRSVYLTQENVFQQSTAQDLKLILEAMLEPGNDRAVRTALATRLMLTSAEEIDALNQDATLQLAVFNEFQHYHEVWQQYDIAPAINALISARNLGGKWLRQPEGERELTNLRHLTELLQVQAMQMPGHRHLLKWFAQQQTKPDGLSAEAQQLRLESDENLVKIVTMHAAKGLEYDIVMLPMPASFRPSDGGPALFHELLDGRYQAALDLGKHPDYAALKEQEDAAEEMRLMYVALTRARYRCYLGLPKTSALGKSAVGRLLRLGEIKKTSELLPLAQSTLPAELFQVIEATTDRQSSADLTEHRDQLASPRKAPAISSPWHIHSYTGVAARIASAEPLAITGFRDDDRDSEAASNRRDRFGLPRGPRTGVVLHSLLENADFTSTSEHAALCRQVISRLALGEEWQPVMEAWLADILATPIGDHRLSDIPRADRLDEMEFHFTLKSEPGLAAFLSREGLIHRGEVPVLKLNGFMTGLVDLVYRFQGRFYIVDYKSNFLGYHQEDYQPAALLTAMNQHDYHLQYMIYTVALHRMLRQRLPDYDYDTHLGGVRYLFLRAMDRNDGAGVFSARPGRDQVEQLDALLGGRP